jgi:phage gp16-like protein
MTALAKLQIAKKEMALHDDDYRAILERLTGQRSAKGLTDAQIGVVLEELKAKGWKPKVVDGGRKGGASARRPADSPTAKKARAMWISLWQLGEVRDRSERALEAFARRQLGVERLVWADEGQMFKLIEALKAMAERAGWSQDLKLCRPEHHLKSLKARLVRAQWKKLGMSIPPEYYMHDTLKWYDETAEALGRKIRGEA